MSGILQQLVVKNEHKTNMCHDVIALCVQNIDIILSSIGNIVGGLHM